jgi:hypothetical protein
MLIFFHVITPSSYVLGLVLSHYSSNHPSVKHSCDGRQDHYGGAKDNSLLDPHDAANDKHVGE